MLRQGELEKDRAGGGHELRVGRLCCRVLRYPSRAARCLNLELKGDVWLEISPMTNDPAWGTDEDKEMDEERE